MAKSDGDANRKKVLSLVRWFVRYGDHAGAAQVLLPLLSPTERKRVALVLTDLVADDDHVTHQEVHAATEEVQRHRSGGGFLH